jgi:glycine/D-amino acid oxidase-like deaminating enzyme
MACGSGRVVADLVLGRAADIRTDDLGLLRHEAAGRRRLAMLPALPTA